MLFSKTVFDYIISCISTSFKKEISILSHIVQKLQVRQYLQNCKICSQESVKKLDFLANFKDIIRTILSINSTFFKLEAQIKDVISTTTKTVLRKSKKKL